MTWDDLIEGRGPDSAPLTDAYREIRRIGPPDAPWPARLAADGARIVMLVDAEVLIGWAGWTRVGAQHALVPDDVARRIDGHDAVFPWCVHPLERMLTRSGTEPGGAIVTLVVSLLRGTEEVWRGLPGEADGPRGRWWLTDGGRPVFVDGEGSPVADEAARLVTEAALRCSDRVLRPFLEEAAEALARPRALGRSIEAIEARLFEACAPQPLRPDSEADVSAPPSREGEHERILPRRRDARRLSRASRVSRAQADTGGATVALRALLERHVDGGVAETVSDVVYRSRRWVRSRLGGGGRRAPWMLAAGAAVLVLVVGLLWPSDSPGAGARAEESLAHRDASASSQVKDADVAQETERGGDAEQNDPVAITARLLDGLEVCRVAGDEACSDVREGEEGAEGSEGAAGSGGELPAAERMPTADERRLSLIEDYGGVAVVRAESPGTGDVPLVVTIVREGDRWLIRDIRDLG